jgi:hypothetical protein
MSVLIVDKDDEGRVSSQPGFLRGHDIFHEAHPHDMFHDMFVRFSRPLDQLRKKLEADMS